MTDGERLAVLEQRLDSVVDNQEKILVAVTDIQTTAARWKGGIFAILGLGGVLLSLFKLWDVLVKVVGG